MVLCSLYLPLFSLPVCRVMDRVRFIPQNCCVCFAHIYPRFLRCTYLLDCLNDSACDDRRRVCMFYVMKWIWKKYNTRSEQCNAGEGYTVDGYRRRGAKWCVYRRLVLPALRFPAKRCFG
jgi:hypothetical protein